MGLGTEAALAQQQPPLNAADSDPVKMGWMIGSPPPADKLIQFSNGSHFAFPQTRWSFANFRRFVPTSNIWRGDSAASPLPRAELADIDTITFQPLGQSGTMTWAQSLAANYTDAIVVLHKGKIVYERYFGVMNQHATHIAMSVTKSFFGTLGATLVAEGKLDEKAPVSQYIPELRDTAYGDATVRQVLDMTVGVKYSENYADPKAEIFDHVRAGGLVPRPPGYSGPTSFYGFLETLKKEGQHGEAFAYKTVNSDVLGWLIRRASGKTVGELLSERIWQKLGMEQDAYMLIDSEGTEFAGGGLNAAVRDLARFGEMMRLDGTHNGQQIVPKAVVDDIRNGGRKSDFEKAGYRTLPGWSYRDMWWVSHNEHGAFMARGVNGQAIYVDPKAEMVIARFGSHPLAANAYNDPTTLPAFDALARHLMQ
ncbi:serine hydrolase [Bradyrhizobium sp. C9]|uniref:serine hydrolase domain-containing protein n=1 Tax=Bradyrhizobium sp. C9 TaxID=142585 RepID=UPI001FE1295D|nr:serine hydrolase [Bradyrhizobium sp. C9]